MKLRVVIMSMSLIAAPALAHDFWVQPQRFTIQPGEPVPVTFQVGHGAARERWGNHNRILFLNDFFGGKRQDLRKGLRSTGPFDLAPRFVAPGLHVVGMQTNYAHSELPAIRFNDYARDEGLAAIIADRRQRATTDEAGRERYSRRAKTLIQVGRATATNQALATQPIGLKLEIVLDRNPYTLGASRNLPLHVLYKGRRLAGATVKLTSLEKDEKPVAVVITDSQGRAQFNVPPSGNWLLNVVWGEPVRGDSRVDYDTTFSSLTFGYGPGRR